MNLLDTKSKMWFNGNMTTNHPATWGTWRAHNHASELLFFGNRTDTRWSVGKKVTLKLSRNNTRVEIRPADEEYLVPGVRVLFLGTSSAFWAAPVENKAQ